MSKKRLQQVIAALIVGALLATSVASMVTAAPTDAPAQEVRSRKVQGEIPGGQFAEIWLGLDTETIGQNITLLGEWNTYDTEGLYFFVLDESDRAAVVSGTHPKDANIAVGNPVEPFRGTPNQQEANFRATAVSATPAADVATGEATDRKRAA